MTTVLILTILLALYRATDNWNYLRGREEMRRLYCPTHSPDAYEVALRAENKRLLCAALVFGTGLVAKLAIFS